MALYVCRYTLIFGYFFYIVVGSIVLNSSNYDAFEADGVVSVCVVIMAEALERTITVQLSSQDSTARSKYNSVCSQHII